VDDSETNISALKGYLSIYELRVDSVLSGLDAIRKISNGNVYDIIFINHKMPVLDGIETTKCLRDMQYDRPIIAYTAEKI